METDNNNEEETRESVRFVKRLLHRSIWVQVDETRWIFGDFVCLDHLKNLILENSFEVNCEGFPRLSESDKRQRLDCCIIPGDKVRRILIEESLWKD